MKSKNLGEDVTGILTIIFLKHKVEPIKLINEYIWRSRNKSEINTGISIIGRNFHDISLLVCSGFIALF